MNHSKNSFSFSRGIRLSVAAALLALLTGLLAIPQPARAETYEVTSIASAGSGSLREAIDKAKTHSGADTITFAESTDGKTIFLTGALDDTNVAGDLDILDDEDLTIQGNGPKNTIIDGSGNDRVFHICPGGGCSNTVTFEGVTIQNGMTYGYGGGILNEAGATTVTGSIISNNTAQEGGGIYNEGLATVSGSTVSDNTATDYGGGIFNDDTLIIGNGSVIGSGNTAGDNGGGIYNAGSATVAGSTVSDNTATYHGGGIYNYSQAVLNIQKGSTIGGTGAGNQAKRGGGIYNEALNTTVTGSTISYNLATIDGGGIYNETGLTTVDSSSVSSNTAAEGGGIYNYDGTLEVKNGSTIGGDSDGNTVTYNGGGIYNSDVGTSTVDGSAVSNNTAGDYGGGIYNDNTLTIRNGSTIGANTATDHDGGGIFNTIGSTTTVDGSTVSANTAGFGGGGIFNEGTLSVEHGSIIGGAGVGNEADVEGGGILNWNGMTTVDGSTVSANKAGTEGGGIYTRGTLIVQKGSTIGGTGAGNTATEEGGGIFNTTGSTTTVNGSTVSANKSGSYGGGIFNEGSGATITVTVSTVSANTAAYNGGGIYNEGTLIVQNGSTVSANTATDFDGGGIYNFGTTTVTGSTISANTATKDGGGIYNWVGTTMVTESRILNNTAASEGGGVYNDMDADKSTSVTNSCIVGNSEHSFFNGPLAEQIATNNWWGAATGPDTAGADTTSGNVKVIPFETVPPIVGCASDLQVGKSNDTGGKGVVGTIFHWALAVSNSGPTSATFKSGQTILKDELPAGPTYGLPAAGSFVDVTNSTNIQCGLEGNTLTCKATGQDVIIATSGSFEVILPVTPGSTDTLTNPAGICKVDPDGNVMEDDENNNDCPENVVTVFAPDLQVGKANDTGGKGTVGIPFHWILTVSNAGSSSATFNDLETILVDDLPTGAAYGVPVVGSFVDVANGANVVCSVTGSSLSCKAAGGGVILGANTGSFEVTLTVTPDAPATLVNPEVGGICKVDPDGKVTEGDKSNNDCPVNTVDVVVSTSFLYLPVVLK